MSGMPPACFFSGLSAISASVVSSRPATLAAFLALALHRRQRQRDPNRRSFANGTCARRTSLENDRTAGDDPPGRRSRGQRLSAGYSSSASDASVSGFSAGELVSSASSSAF
jgi:hypothetical protein